MSRMVPIKFVHGKINLNLILYDLRIIDADNCIVPKEPLPNINGRGFSSVLCIFLEGKSENGNLLSRYFVKHG